MTRRQATYPIRASTSDRHRTVTEDRIIKTLLLGGWVFDQTHASTDECQADVRAALDRWIDHGLGFCRSGDGRLFDLVEVMNVMTVLGLSGQDPVWRERYVETGRRLVTHAAPGNALERRFQVRLRRRFDLRAFETGQTVRLRMPLPLPCPSLTQLRVDPERPAGLDAVIRTNDGRLEMRGAVQEDRVIELGACVHFTARRGSSPDPSLSDDDKALYLRPSEGLIRLTPPVVALAHALADTSTSDLDAVRAFWIYLMEQCFSGMVHYDEISPDIGCGSVLETGWFDCQLGSALLIALCRARGIPARLVSGHVLYPLAPTNHYWSEVWIAGSGWTPFDLLCWTLSDGGSDTDWRDHFFASLDFRLITQIFPLSFTGAAGVRMPKQWQMVQAAAEDGVVVTFQDAEGTLIFEDLICVMASP